MPCDRVLVSVHFSVHVLETWSSICRIYATLPHHCETAREMLWTRSQVVVVVFTRPRPDTRYLASITAHTGQHEQVHVLGPWSPVPALTHTHARSRASGRVLGVGPRLGRAHAWGMRWPWGRARRLRGLAGESPPARAVCAHKSWVSLFLARIAHTPNHR